MQDSLSAAVWIKVAFDLRPRAHRDVNPSSESPWVSGHVKRRLSAVAACPVCPETFGPESLSAGTAAMGQNQPVYMPNRNVCFTQDWSFVRGLESGGSSPMSDLGKASARQLVNSRNVFQTSIPLRTARNKNMGGGLSFDRAIEASSRDDQQSPIHLNTRKR